eukprot:TRINITY_DN60325_c0_g1_i1.p1 TRINITY_DN60325_c0_g1~~TRINITY_DN60325_c0_g1_i1.p1  ORF type:complete len:325 (+),score=115.13 TRINITY_DN60325_c0_g1_i1:76-975(+)
MAAAGDAGAMRQERVPVALRFLAGRTVRVGELPLRGTVGAVKRAASAVCGIPAAAMSLAMRGRPVADDAHIAPLAGDCGGLVFNCSLRLRGGKGGFGSNLRARGKAASQKTTNFDACRDLSGNRIRHVRQEKALEQWAKGDENADEETMQDVGAALTPSELRDLRRKREADLRDAQRERDKQAFRTSAEERDRRVKDGWALEQEKLQAAARDTRDAIQAAAAGVKRGLPAGDGDGGGSTTEAERGAVAPAPAPKRPRRARHSVFAAAVSDTSGVESGAEGSAARRAALAAAIAAGPSLD